MYVNDQIEDTFAMAIGDAFRLEDLSAEEWVNRSAAKLNPRLVKRELTTLSSKTKNVLERVAGEVCAEGAGARQASCRCAKKTQRSTAASCCTSDEGRPLGIADQAEIPNYPELRP
jgi:hypothetical protein